MEPPQEPVRTGWLTEQRKDLIAAGLFGGLCLVAFISLRLHHIPIGQPIYKISILKDLPAGFVVFKPN